MIAIPENYNYIAAFLTFRCSLNCSYCINRFEYLEKGIKEISGKKWIEFLNRIKTRPDLPLTLQGGEPTLHRDFFEIVNNIDTSINLDLLTNLEFSPELFMKEVSPERFKRQAPYASIRVSYHPEAMNLEKTFEKTLLLLKNGYSIGIWSVLHPKYEEHILEAQKKGLDSGIDFRTKEFLGTCDNKLYGLYKYPGCFDSENLKSVNCKTTELLIGPQGSVFRCHSDLYANRSQIDSISRQNFSIKDTYRNCEVFGKCNPCDVKIKTNRFQEFGHTSVEIKFKGEPCA